MVCSLSDPLKSGLPGGPAGSRARGWNEDATFRRRSCESDPATAALHRRLNTVCSRGRCVYLPIVRAASTMIACEYIYRMPGSD